MSDVYKTYIMVCNKLRTQDVQDVALYKATLKSLFRCEVIETEQELLKAYEYNRHVSIETFANSLEMLNEGFYICFATLNYSKGEETIIHSYINRTKTYCAGIFTKYDEGE